MDIARMLAVIIVHGTMAIVIGGLMYDWFHSYAAVAVWEIILVAIAVGVAVKVARKKSPFPSHGH